MPLGINLVVGHESSCLRINSTRALSSIPISWYSRDQSVCTCTLIREGQLSSINGFDQIIVRHVSAEEFV